MKDYFLMLAYHWEQKGTKKGKHYARHYRWIAERMPE